MRLEDRIKEMIRRRKAIALELFKKSRDKSFRLSKEALEWLQKNGYIIKGNVRANVLDFFRNKVVLLEGNTLSLKAV